MKYFIILELAGFILFWCVGMLLRDKNDKYKYLRPVIFGLLWTPFCVYQLCIMLMRINKKNNDKNSKRV